MKKILLYLLLLPMLAHAAVDIDKRAAQLAKKYPLVDTHIDVPYRINRHWEDVTVATTDGQFDYPRAVAGGLNIALTLGMENGAREFAARVEAGRRRG